MPVQDITITIDRLLTGKGWGNYWTVERVWVWDQDGTPMKPTFWAHEDNNWAYNRLHTRFINDQNADTAWVPRSGGHNSGSATLFVHLERAVDGGLIALDPWRSAWLLSSRPKLTKGHIKSGNVGYTPHVGKKNWKKNPVFQFAQRAHPGNSGGRVWGFYFGSLSKQNTQKKHMKSGDPL